MSSAPMHVKASSVDLREVQYFDKHAAMWWDDSGPFWPLHRLNRLRMTYIREQLCQHFGLDPNSDRPLAGLTVLDVGCGGGILSESMAELGAKVTGIDVVDRNISVASQHAKTSGLPIDYQLTSAESLVSKNRQFDVVLNMEVVEHVADLPGFMAAVCRLLKSGGMMLIATINRTPIAGLIAIIGAEYILRWMPKGTHRYFMLRRPAEIRSLLASHGLVSTKPVGVGVNPFRRHMFLTRLTSVNYMLTATHAIRRRVQVLRS